MSKSISKQLEHAVYECFTPGHSKRADKFNTAIDTSWKIYSTTSKRDMLDLAKDFGKYLAAEHPTVKRAYEINGDIIQSYIDSKASTCVDKTLQKIISRVGKLERCCIHAYHGSGFDWQTDKIIKPESTKNADFIKNTPVPLTVSIAILATCERKRSQVANAICMSVYAGMRANEAVHLKAENVHFTGGEFGHGWIQIIEGPEGGAKGGRPRVIPIINPEAKEAIRKAVTGKKPEQYIAPRRDGGKMTPDNVQRTLREVMDARYGNTYKGNRCHGMRKTWAQTYYDMVRRGGFTRAEAVEKTNEVIGHGSKRGVEMVKMYVANIW